jgi:hypothetical protein
MFGSGRIAASTSLQRDTEDERLLIDREAQLAAMRAAAMDLERKLTGACVELNESRRAHAEMEANFERVFATRKGASRRSRSRHPG